MAVTRPARSAQKLRIVRTVEGDVSGCLQCSVALDFGAKDVLVLEDSLTGVPVGEVLNPQSGVFLADEVQRLMRIGAAQWLTEALADSPPAKCSSKSPEVGWRVSFQVPLANGDEREVHIDVEGAVAADHVEARAMERLAYWRDQLSRRPLDRELLDTLSDLDLRSAPYLRRGLAIVHPSTGS